MKINEYITRLKLFYHSFLKFIENDADIQDSLQQIITYITDNNFGENSDELRSMLHIINKVSLQHKRNLVNLNKTQKILLHFENKIKQTFSNLEIFKIFKSDKLLLLFLFKQKIITIDDGIFTHLLEKHGRFFSNFFYPEIKPFLANKQRGTIPFVEINKFPLKILRKNAKKVKMIRIFVG